MTPGPAVPRLYLAGPDIFHPDARVIAGRKKALCTRHGFVGLDPLDSDLPNHSGTTAAMAIYRANMDLMLSADAIIANLTPFRGPSADPGTVFELGFMLALGRPAFGYSGTAEPFTERTAALCGSGASADLCGSGASADLCGSGASADRDGYTIEDFGLHDNLMIDCALRASGVPMILPVGILPVGIAPGDGDDQAGLLGGFIHALEAARRHFEVATPGSGASPGRRP